MKKTITNSIKLSLLAIILLCANNTHAQSIYKKATKMMLDSAVFEAYDTILKTYHYNSYQKFYYDFSGKCSLYIQKKYNKTSNVFDFDVKVEPTYDINGNNIGGILYTWDNSSNNWIYISKYVYSYDNNNNLIKNLSFRWDKVKNVWTNSSKTDYTYNSNNKLTSRIDSSWNVSSWDILNPIKLEYLYDVNGNNTTIIQYQVDGIRWDSIYKTECTYDNNHNKTLEIKYTSLSTNNWQKTDKSEYVYDAFNNETLYKYFSYYQGTDSLIHNQTDTRSYNLSYKYADIFIPVLYTFATINTPTNIVNDCVYQNFRNNILSYTSRDTYFYSPFLQSSIQEKEMPSTSVYPNPSNGIFTINSNQDIANINIYDITGKEVHNQEYTNKLNQTEIDLSALNNGIYFIAVQSSNGETSKSKIVLAK